MFSPRSRMHSISDLEDFISEVDTSFCKDFDEDSFYNPPKCQKLSLMEQDNPSSKKLHFLKRKKSNNGSRNLNKTCVHENELSQDSTIVQKGQGLIEAGDPNADTLEKNLNRIQNKLLRSGKAFNKSHKGLKSKKSILLTRKNQSNSKTNCENQQSAKGSHTIKTTQAKVNQKGPKQSEIKLKIKIKTGVKKEILKTEEGSESRISSVNADFLQSNLQEIRQLDEELYLNFREIYRFYENQQERSKQIEIQISQAREDLTKNRAQLQETRQAVNQTQSQLAEVEKQSQNIDKAWITAIQALQKGEVKVGSDSCVQSN